MPVLGVVAVSTHFVLALAECLFLALLRLKRLAITSSEAEGAPDVISVAGVGE